MNALRPHIEPAADAPAPVATPDAGSAVAPATQPVSPAECALPNPFAPAQPHLRAAPQGAHIVVEKVAGALRELDTRTEPLEFVLTRTLGYPSENNPAPADGAPPAAGAYTATCLSVSLPELARCAVKIVDRRELAENEWYHLVTYRNPLFPAPFLLGRLASDGRFLIVMEFIEGVTLQRLIDAGFGGDHGGASAEKALEIVSPLASSFKMLALSFREFVHRDIKPANIVVTQGACRTRLIDLGVSAHERDRLQHAHAGATPGYAPPELAHPQDYPANEPVSYCDPRIDTYSLAATFHALVVGCPPREAGVTLPTSALRHDAQVIEQVRAQARNDLKFKHGRTVGDELLDALVAQVVSDADERLAALVTRGLSCLQAERPTPAEFFDALPSNYVGTLVNAVQIAYLSHLSAPDRAPAAASLRTVQPAQGDAVELSHTPLSDDYRYEGFLEDFRRSIDCWNRGDYHTAVPLFKKLDAAGDPTAQYNLGICYRDGLGGITPDRTLMLAYWTRAAEGGNIVAAYNVAVCHEKGDGIPVMPDTAAMWYRRSAQGGFPAAQTWLSEHGE